MDINYVLTAHGVIGKSNGSSIAYENVTNFTATSITEGTQVSITWTNPTVTEYVKTEVFVANIDLTNINYDTCVANHTKIVNGTTSSYTHNATINTTYYFKAFVTYLTFGENKISTGVSTSVLTTDTTPPNPITNFVATGGDSKVDLSWTNPTNIDFNKTKVLYKIGNYPTSDIDGTVAYEGSGTTATVTGLANDTLYYFRAFTYDNSLNVNSDVSQQVTATPKAYVLYGVKIDTTNSNPETALTYTDHSIGFTPASGNNGLFNYGSWQDKFPFNQIKPCVLLNGTVNYYLNPNDYTKKLDGSVADIISGTDGDVMVEFPKIYWKFETVGTDLYIKYSDIQVDSGYKCLAHTRGVTEKNKIYLSAYLGYNLSSKLRSLSGKTPTVSQTIGSFRTLAHANGTGYEQHPYFQLLMLQVLFVVMFKSLDSQTKLGRGYVDGNNASIATGGANTKGLFYGETTGKQQNKFCGIEDFWGNCFYWIDGLFSDANRNILIGTDSFNDTGNSYTSYGQGATANISGYINSVQGSTETGFIAKSSSGSATTYYCDIGALAASGLPIFGSAWGGASDAGAFRLNVNYSASDVASVVAARLAFI